MDFSPSKHKLGGPGRKYVIGSERTQLMEEGIIHESRPKVRKVDSDGEDSDFECYDQSGGKPVHVDIDKEIAEGNKPTLAKLPNRSEEDENNNNAEIRDRDGNINLPRSNRIFEPL